MHRVTSFGLLRIVQPKSFTKKSAVRQHQTTQMNHPQACKGNQERRVRSHFTRHIAIHLFMADKKVFDTWKLLQIVTQSSFEVMHLLILFGEMLIKHSLKRSRKCETWNQSECQRMCCFYTLSNNRPHKLLRRRAEMFLEPI